MKRDAYLFKCKSEVTSLILIGKFYAAVRMVIMKTQEFILNFLFSPLQMYVDGSIKYRE